MIIASIYTMLIVKLTENIVNFFKFYVKKKQKAAKLSATPLFEQMPQ